jgi:hypothetical protein
MIHTAIAADAEVRRLKRLGEATHDWSERVPPATPPISRAANDVAHRIVGSALRGLVALCVRTGSAASLSAPEGGPR